MQTITLQLIIVALLIALMAFFALAEAAVSNARKSTLKEKSEAGDKRAAIGVTLVESPGSYLSTARVGGSLAGFFVVATGAASLADPLRDWIADGGTGFFADHAWGIAVTLITLMLSALCIVFGQLLPDAIGTEHANSLVFHVARPLKFFSLLLRPVVWLLTGATNLVLRFFRSEERVTMTNVTEAEILALVEAAEDEKVLEASEADLVEDALQFGDTLVRNVMVPRVDVIGIEASAPLRQAADLFFSTGFSRLPVFREAPDNVAGILYVKDVMKRLWDRPGAANTQAIRVIRPAWFVPESKPIADLLEELRTKQTHMAIVLDEYGGLAGIITLEDLLEELVGEIEDEFDTDPEPFLETEPGVWEIDGGLPLLDLIDRLDLDRDAFGEAESESVSGLIAEQIGRIPEVGDIVVAGPLTLEVLAMDGYRVGATTVRLTGDG